MAPMKPTDTFKALSNEYRYQMLLWLKSPLQHFAAHAHCVVAHDFQGGVCVGLGGESRRIGKWTYYRYHRAGVEALLQQLREQI